MIRCETSVRMISGHGFMTCHRLSQIWPVPSDVADSWPTRYQVHMYHGHTVCSIRTISSCLLNSPNFKHLLKSFYLSTAVFQDDHRVHLASGHLS